MSTILIADSGSTKAEWCLVKNKKKKTFFTQGMSPYFLDQQQIEQVLRTELAPSLAKESVDAVYYYGTGTADPGNAKLIKKALQTALGVKDVEVQHDLMGAARSVCGRGKGIASILGTGSNSCYYNGSKIMKNSPGLGYVLGDEGSGAYLGKKVVQYFLYKTFDEELMARFEGQFNVTGNEILDAVYRKPLPNRYLASFAVFLAENRGHYMIENIVEDGLNDFFFSHLCKYRESWSNPLHFVGSVAYGFRDVIKELASSYELELGKIVKAPMEGLIDYHTKG